VSRAARTIASALLVCMPAGASTKEPPRVNDVVIRQGTVADIGGTRVGVMWVFEHEYALPDGSKRRGLAAGLALTPPERNQTVGRGSIIELGSARYEVVKIDETKNPETVTLRLVGK
jgi:hypothetical protein